MEKPTERVYYFDVIRALACMMVPLIHIAADYLGTVAPRMNFCVGSFVQNLSRPAVPLFVMISGALMLDENYDFSSDKLRRHLKKMALFFVFWSALYAVGTAAKTCVLQHRLLGIGEFFKHFLVGHYHLWFCYMIMGLYLIVPILRLWVKRVNRRYVAYFLLLGFLFSGIFPQLIRVGKYFSGVFSHADGLLGQINFQYAVSYVLYFVLGWYLSQIEIKHKRTLILAGAAGFLFGFGSQVFLSLRAGATVVTAYDTGASVVLFAAAIFLAIKEKCGVQPPEKSPFSGAVRLIAQNSLGVYAIHAAVLTACFAVTDALHFSAALAVIPIVYAVTFTVSLLLSVLCSKIPVIKKFV